MLKGLKKNRYKFAYEFWNTALGSNDSKYLSEISPITHIKNLKKPLLIFHGKQDEIVPVEQAELMNEELKRHDKQVRLEILPKDGHSISSGLRISYILNSAEKFFRRAENMKK